MDALQIEALKAMTPGEWRVFVASELVTVKERLGRLEGRRGGRIPWRWLMASGLTGLATVGIIGNRLLGVL